MFRRYVLQKFGVSLQPEVRAQSAPRLDFYFTARQCNAMVEGTKMSTSNEGLRVGSLYLYLRVGSWGSWLWQEDISYVWLHIHQVLYFCALFVGGCLV